MPQCTRVDGAIGRYACSPTTGPVEEASEYQRAGHALVALSRDGWLSSDRSGGDPLFPFPLPGDHERMRVETCVTAISWIPSEMIQGLARVPFTVGVTHHDVAPPVALDGPVDDALEHLRTADRFRIANHLAAWVDVVDGVIIDHGQRGGGVHGATTINLGGSWSIPAIPFPDLRAAPVLGEGWVRFSQTVGGRTGVPAPRRIERRPYVQVSAPPVWTTLQLTIHADGRCEPVLAGASAFPRHWVYDHGGQLIAKSGVVDFHGWDQSQSVEHCPWKGRDAVATVAGPGSELEHGMAERVMHGPAEPTIRMVAAGTTLMRQGDPSHEIALVLDGVAQVVVDDTEVARIGPGAIVGERASLEFGCRTASLIAVTACKLAVIEPDAFDTSTLATLSGDHHREDEPRSDDPVN